jgi:hypothetical protein
MMVLLMKILDFWTFIECVQIFSLEFIVSEMDIMPGGSNSLKPGQSRSTNINTVQTLLKAKLGSTSGLFLKVWTCNLTNLSPIPLTFLYTLFFSIFPTFSVIHTFS